MPIIDPDSLQLVDKPELMIALVAAVGTPLNHVENTITEELESRGYEIHSIRLSESLAGLDLKAPAPASGAGEYERISSLMNRGDELRELAGGGEALALLAAAEINDMRPDPDPSQAPALLAGKAFIFNQLKHPDEVYWLRRIYGPALHIVGVYCPQSVRKDNLVVHNGMKEQQAETLIKRDEGEEQAFGQQLRETFHLSDVFVELSGDDEGAAQRMATQVQRYIALIFADLREGITTPTPEEYGMHLAFTASLRSADLSRQVGAAILTPTHEVVALGTNEAPAYGGGQYWDEESSARDSDLGYDSNARIRLRTLEEVLEVALPDFKALDEDEKSHRLNQVAATLGSARIMNLTEFGRAVHAEMEAVLSAGRIGVSVRGCDLFTTTFPCHNCAKHIVDAGIRRVVYIEPYPPSLSRDLHDDAIAFGEEGTDKEKVIFEPFVGVAPRMYRTVFSILTPEGRRLSRKDEAGDLNRKCLGLRRYAAATTYIDLEATAAAAARRIGQITTRERKDEG